VAKTDWTPLIVGAAVVGGVYLATRPKKAAVPPNAVITVALPLPTNLQTEVNDLYRRSLDPAAFDAEAAKLDALGYTVVAQQLRNYGAALRRGIGG